MISKKTSPLIVVSDSLIHSLFEVKDGRLVYGKTTPWAGKTFDDYRGALFQFNHLFPGVFSGFKTSYMGPHPVDKSLQELIEKDTGKPSEDMISWFKLDEVTTVKQDNHPFTKKIVLPGLTGTSIDMLVAMVIAPRTGNYGNLPLTEVTTHLSKKSGQELYIDLLGSITPASTFNTLMMIANLLPKNRDSQAYHVRVWDVNRQPLYLSEKLISPELLRTAFPDYHFLMEYHLQDLNSLDLNPDSHSKKSDAAIADILSFYLSNSQFIGLNNRLWSLMKPDAVWIHRELEQPNGPPPPDSRNISHTNLQSTPLAEDISYFFPGFDATSHPFQIQYKKEIKTPFKDVVPDAQRRYLPAVFGPPDITRAYSVITTTQKNMEGNYPRYFTTHVSIRDLFGKNT
jgi:hypothetical protein